MKKICTENQYIYTNWILVQKTFFFEPLHEQRELQNTRDDAHSVEQVNDKSMTGHDRVEILVMKDNQIGCGM